MIKKILTFILFIFICLILRQPIWGQKSNKSSKSKKVTIPKKIRSLIIPLPKKVVEIEDWKEYTFTEDYFKSEFPKVPEIQKKEYVEDGLIVKRSYYQTDINSTFFLVSIAEYPKNLLPNRNDLGENFADWLKEFILNGEEILSEKLIELQNYKGVEFIYSQSSKDLVIHRIFVVNQSLFQVIIHVESNGKESYLQTFERHKIKIERFLNSFTFTKDFLDKEIY